jgi:hypothetical protein
MTNINDLENVLTTNILTDNLPNSQKKYKVRIYDKSE